MYIYIYIYIYMAINNDSQVHFHSTRPSLDEETTSLLPLVEDSRINTDIKR